MEGNIKEFLEQVKRGEISVDEAALELKKQPFYDVGYAKVDMHRKIRQGVGEVIYGEGKTPEQIVGIVSVMVKNGQEHILVTRVDEEKMEAVVKLLVDVPKEEQIIPEEDFLLQYDKDSRALVIGGIPEIDGIGKIVVATGGTSDIPVAEEAAVTAEFLGNEVVRLYDVGVAGLHRTLSHMDDLMEANVVIAIAGMEGALASVLGGLVDRPVIAVPTSVGYGASFGGISALLSMLNSCASGVSVVNIDNGFGAAYQASLINHTTVSSDASDQIFDE
ncbi:MAG: nickel pincer cofactor biosynthesis protein LarB [Lachnospiraceae bacterium]|nr:nickel pincer cofactor biosynthesis protein LarB [Lachnospiraceae bacterium]